MWFLKKTSLVFVICHALCCTLPTIVATGPLRSTSGSFNKTEHSDIVTDSNEVHLFTSNATLYSDEKSRRRLLDTTGIGENDKRDPIRILYTVTTLSEFEKGTRSTAKVSHIQNCCFPAALFGSCFGIKESKIRKGNSYNNLSYPFYTSSLIFVTIL